MPPKPLRAELQSVAPKSDEGESVESTADRNSRYDESSLKHAWANEYDYGSCGRPLYKLRDSISSNTAHDATSV